MFLLSTLESSTLKNIGQLCSVLFIFIFVLFLTYFVTKWIAGYQQSQMFHKNLRIVETMKLTTNKYIQIIEVGDVYLVLGISKDHVETLAELTKDQLQDYSLETENVVPDFKQGFADVLENVKKHLPKK